MTIVQTATGPIDSAALGFTLMHEHVLAMSWAMRSVIPNWFDRDATIREAVAEAKSARERGVNAIVDLTPINLGRDVHIIREVADARSFRSLSRLASITPRSYGRTAGKPTSSLRSSCQR